MKLKILIGVLLVAVVGELVWLSAALSTDYSEAQIQNWLLTAQLQRIEQEAINKQAELDGFEDNVCGEINGKIQRLREEIAMLEGQKEEINAEIPRLEQELETLAQECAALEEENEYYLEVYNELKEGLEKVKGYIAGD